MAARDLDARESFSGEFHGALHGATHDAVMAEQAVSIRAPLDVFRSTQLRRGARIAASHEEHGRVLAAIARGDGERAGGGMRAHRLDAASALGRYIADAPGG